MQPLQHHRQPRRHDDFETGTATYFVLEPALVSSEQHYLWGETLIDDEVTRNAIAEAMRTAVDRVVRQQVRRGISQEAQITAKIGPEVERALDGETFGGYQLRVAVQDFSDRGSAALEGEYGSDLYIGIQTIEERPKSKGMLIQAKIVPQGRRKIVRSSDLVEQCERMHDVSGSGSYVWVYDRNGVGVSTAGEILGMPKYSRKKIGVDTVYDQIRRVLECSEGDPHIGLLPTWSGVYIKGPDGDPEFDGALGDMLRSLGARSGIGITARRRR